MARSCVSCGSRSTETAFPARGSRCCDCLAERARVPPERTVLAMTRASYRAALRHRRTLAQLDLVDLVVPAP